MINEIEKTQVSSEAERAVIGTMLADSGLIPIIVDELDGKEFIDSWNKRFFKLIVKLYNQEPKEFNVIKVSDLLVKLTNKPQADIRSMILSYTNEIVSTAHYQSYVNIVKNNYILNKAYEIFSNSMTSAEISTASQKLQEAICQLTELTRESRRQELSKVSDSLAEWYQSIYEPNTNNLIDLGILGLDTMLGGIGNTDLTILAARPSTGKTAFAIEITKSLLIQGKTVVLYSLEMNKEQILNRMLSNISKVPHHFIKRHEIPQEHSSKLAECAAVMQNWGEHFYINDTSNLKVSQIRNECTAVNADCIIVDHIGLLNPEERRKDLRESMTEITRNLKILADDISTSIIALSQLNRSVEGRADQRPMLSDLRESGSIEQDANNVIFLFKTNKDEENSPIGISVAKNRNGGLGCIVKAFDRDTQSFSKNFKPYSFDNKNEKYNPVDFI